MRLRKNHKENASLCALIDVSSGSVAAAIVRIDTVAKTSTELWSHREYTLSKEHTDQTSLLKDLNTTLVNALLELGGSGLRTLSGNRLGGVIEHIYINLYAPWVHTATKNITYEKEAPFVVEDELIDQLVHASGAQGQEYADILSKLGLTHIRNSVAEIALNEYVVKDPHEKKANAIALSVVSCAAQEKLIMTIKESCEKILPSTDIVLFAHIDVLYRTLRDLKPSTADCAIIDIGDEAVELGIVRDDVLRYATHIPFGSESIIRTLAESLSVPAEEARGLLKKPDIESSYSGKELEQIHMLSQTVCAQLLTLMRTTGDALMIPHTIFLYAPEGMHEYFVKHIQQVCSTLSTCERMVHSITKDILPETTSTDPSVAIFSYFLTHTLHENTEM
jgi:hypothetical protein